MFRKNIRKNIRFLVLDFDGVMTDNKVYISQDGTETVCCSRADGLGIEQLKKRNLKILVISKERNKVVSARCRKLKIRVKQGIDAKLKILTEEAKRLKILPSEICYLGNDVNDIDCVEYAGLGCAVKDSHPSLLKVADYVTKNKGGNGAVKEICDLLLQNAGFK